jgi:hypothetical protein
VLPIYSFLFPEQTIRTLAITLHLLLFLCLSVSETFSWAYVQHGDSAPQCRKSVFPSVTNSQRAVTGAHGTPILQPQAGVSGVGVSKGDWGGGGSETCLLMWLYVARTGPTYNRAEAVSERTTHSRR